MHASPRPQIHAGEIAALCGAAALIIGACFFVSQKQLFSLDEMLTALTVSQHSFAAMLSSLKDEINAMPPLYFAAGWCWVKVFGASEFSLRLPSALAISLALVCVWDGLRGFTNRWVAVLCSIGIPLLCWEIRRAAFDARPYGWYFAAYSLAFALYVRSAEETTTTGRWSIWVVLTHATLVAIHYVGGLFSALLVAAAFATWIFDGDRRYLRHGVNAAIGWLALIPSVPFYLAQRKLATELSWLERPDLSDLLESFTCGIDGFPLIATSLLCTLLLVASLRAPDLAMASRPHLPGGLRPAAILSMLSLLFLPAIWLESQWGARLFLLRYLSPTLICWACAMGWAGNWLLAQCQTSQDRAPAANQTTAWDQRLSVRRRWLTVAVTLGFLGLPVVAATARFCLDLVRLGKKVRRPETILSVIQKHPDLPVLTGTPQDLTMAAFYLHDRTRVSMVLESREPDSSLHQRFGTALERHFFPNSITQLGPFLASTDRFLFVDRKLAYVPFMAEHAELAGQSITGDIWLWERRDQR